MKQERFQRYLEERQKKAPFEKHEIAEHPDQSIDKDFPGYPHGTAKEEIIKPSTKQQKKVAAVNTKDGEKELKSKPRKKIKEENSVGSGGAFEGTESVKE